MPVLALASAAQAQAQSVTRVAPDRVTVRAEAVPIGDLLAELLTIAPIESVALDPASASVPVTLIADDVPPLAAIVMALKAANLDFIMLDDKQLRVGYASKLTEPRRQAPAVRFRGPEPAERAAGEVPDRGVSQDREPSTDPDRRSDVGAASPAAAAANVEGAIGVAATSASEFDHAISVRDVPYVINGDSVIVTEPGFVPYRNRPEVRRERLSVDVTLIP